MQKKLTFLILFSLFISWGAHSQYKSYFGKEYTKWYVYFAEIYEYTIRIGILSDETIQKDGKEYFLTKHLQGGGEWDTDYCYLREDKELGRLFCLDKEAYINDGKEFLISDMSLQKGDTVYFPKNLSLNSYIFDKGLEQNETGFFTLVDSVYNKDNKKHIQTALNSNIFNVPLTYIEGLGLNYSVGFFMNKNDWYMSRLICFENEDEFWKNEEFWTPKDQGIPKTPDECNYNAGGISHLKAPNPFRTITSKTTIEVLFDNELTGTVRLYNINAREMISREIEKATSVTIPIESLPKGSYILWVYDKHGDRVWSEKLVISTR